MNKERVPIASMILALGLAGSTFAEDPAPPTPATEPLIVTVRHPKSEVGLVLVRVFRTGDDILGPSFLNVVLSPTAGGVVTTSIPLPLGRFAVVVAWDENQNQRIDHTFGIPSETMRFSGGWALTLFSGPPRFEDLAFTHGRSPSTLSLDLTD